MSGYVGETGFISPQKLHEFVSKKADTRRKLDEFSREQASNAKPVSVQFLTNVPPCK